MRINSFHFITAMRNSAVRLCVTLLLCGVAVVPAVAQQTPDGYEPLRQAGRIDYRPTGDEDDLLRIQVMLETIPADSPIDAVNRWIAAHPPAGKTLEAPTQAEIISPGVALSARAYAAGSRTIQEGILAVRNPTADYQIQIISVPRDRNDMQPRHMKASGAITRAIAKGDYAKLSKASPAGSPARKPDRATAASALATSPAQKMIGQIQTVGFYSKTTMGYGGMIMMTPTPVVLFKNGTALKDIALLSHDAGSAHRNPDDWTQWKRSGSNILLLKKGAWEKLYYTKTMDRLPAGFMLQGRYQRVSGTGNLAMGGSDAVVVWSDMTFDRSGSFTSGGGAGASATAENGGVTSGTVTSSRADSNSGRYRIEGYTLTLDYGSGKVERRMIVTDPGNIKVIWLDGDGYTKRR
jgi:hypothetical protein